MISECALNQDSLKKFLSLTGGSILYCLSALSIIYGIAQIIGPLLAESNVLGQTLPCVIVLNVYELALLGVLVLIAAWKNVTDDAVSLIVLIAIFLIATGITLGTVVPSGPVICLYIGIACSLLAVGKILAMRHFINFRVGSFCLVGLTIIFLWNFIASSIMGKYFVAGNWPDESRRNQWLAAWIVILIGAAFILFEAISKKTNTNSKNSTKPVFIHTKLMVWIFALIIFVAAGIHQYAVSYMFVVDSGFGDYIPLIAIGSFLLLELIIATQKKLGPAHVIAALLPFVAIMFAIATRSIVASSTIGFELLWYPPVTLTIISVGLLLSGFYLKRPWLYWIAIVYVLTTLLTFGYSHLKPEELNFKFFGCGLIFIMFVVGIKKRNVAICLTAVIILAIGLGSSDMLSRFIQRNNLRPITMMAGITGLGTMVIYLIFNKKVQPVLRFFGAIALIIFIFDFQAAVPQLRDLAVAGCVVILCAALFIRTQNFIIIAVICIPSAQRLYILSREMPSWGFVILSFALLFTGAAVSIFRKRVKLEHATTEISEEKIIQNEQ